MDKDKKEIKAEALEVIREAVVAALAAHPQFISLEFYADKLASRILCSHEQGLGYCTKCGWYPYYGKSH